MEPTDAVTVLCIDSIDNIDSIDSTSVGYDGNCLIFLLLMSQLMLKPMPFLRYIYVMCATREDDVSPRW